MAAPAVAAAVASSVARAAVRAALKAAVNAGGKGNSGVEIKGLKQLQRKLENMPNNIAKANVKAMQRTTRKARDEARKEAESVFDNPRSQTINAIDNRWPSISEVKAGRGTAAVFVKGFLVNSIYPNVYRERETAVPKSGQSVLIPAKGARLTKAGNISGLRSGSVQRQRRQRDKHLNVPIGNRNPSTRHLRPGLYRIMGGKSRNKSRSRQKLKSVYFYETSRTLDNQVFKRYPAIVHKAYRKHYEIEFQLALSEQLRK